MDCTGNGITDGPKRAEDSARTIGVARALVGDYRHWPRDSATRPKTPVEFEIPSAYRNIFEAMAEHPIRCEPGEVLGIHGVAFLLHYSHLFK